MLSIEAPHGYQRREPRLTLLHQVVREQLPAFLAGPASEGGGADWPAFVARELHRYLDCGIPEGGFLRVHCDGCGHDRVVAFSCKGRAICPSCATRRMQDTAAHLNDRVLVDAPHRQWVLSMPRRIRYLLAYRPDLITRVLDRFLRVAFAWQRLRARRLGLPGAVCGAVTFVQRFGSALNLNVHFHALLPDGVFTFAADGDARFHALSPPTPQEVEALTRTIRRRILASLEGLEAEAESPLAAAAARSMQVSLPGMGDDPPPTGRLCAMVQGFSLHADVAVRADRRDQLEKLCRYGARPPIALGRLSATPEGKLSYRVKRRGGRDLRLTLERKDLLPRLAPLIPPPRMHVTRYAGCFAPNSRHRAAVIALVPVPASLTPDHQPPVVPSEGTPPSPRARYLPWATLLRRIFAIDALVCERCGGAMRILSIIDDPAVAEAIVRHLGLSPPSARAPPPELDQAAPWSDEDFIDPPAPLPFD